MDSEHIPAIAAYLKDRAAYKWSTSHRIINELGLAPMEPLALDRILVAYCQTQQTPEIRFSTLPSSVSLEVLWGHIDRVGERSVTDIFRLDSPDREQRLVRPEEVNMFLSYSFRDSALALALSRKLRSYGLYAWIAEAEILRRAHINDSVIEALIRLPHFGVLITDNMLRSTWSAKEVDFALRQGKSVRGFVHTGRIAEVKALLYSQSDNPQSVRRKMIDRIFDKHPEVRFLPFPEDESGQRLHALVGADYCIPWESLADSASTT